MNSKLILKTSSFILLFCFSIFSIQCSKEKKSKTIDSDFKTYITAFTSGIISNQSTIKIRLSEPYKDAKPNELLTKDVFEFTPEISGETFWLDENTIEFRPSEKLPQGKLFDAEFHLSELIDVPKKLEDFTFDFQVLKQFVEVEFEGMKLKEKSAKSYTIHGKVVTNDYSEPENIQKSVSATQNGKDVSIIWEHSIDGKSHQFTLDNVQRTESRGQVILQWNGELLDFDEQGEKVFEVPPLGEFKVLGVQITQEPDQFVTLYFSDPIDKNQDLEGLIYFQPMEDFRMVQEENSVKIYPNSRISGTVKLKVTDGIKSSLGYHLMESFEKQLEFVDLKPALALIGDGVILPSTDGLNFPFKAVNLSAVNVKIIKVFENNIGQFLQNNQFDGTNELKRVGRIVYKGEIQLKSDVPTDFSSWNNYSIDLSKLIESEPGAIYRVHLSFNKRQSLYPCDESDNKDSFTDFSEDNEDESYDNPNDYWYYDDEYVYYNQDYNYEERDNPCKSSYYIAGNRSVSRNILASDLGIIAKGGTGNTLTVAITDLKTTEPLSNVTVEFYSFQNQLITSKATNAEGMLQVNLEKKPFLLVAKKESQRGYLRLDDGSALSLSMFDIGGQKVQKGVKGLLYGERGVWRPGDSIYLTFLLQDKNKVLPENHPVVFELYTPQQQLYKRVVKTTSLNGFYDFRTATEQDAVTGNWQAKVKLGGSVYSKSLKIEAIKPNRLKINLDFKTKILKDTEKPKGDLEIKWLHGAIAGNLKADIELKLSRGNTAFEKFEGYQFDDPSKEFYAEENVIFDGKVDENGKTVVSPEIQVQKNAPGMLQANFKIRAFEKGGDFSIDRFSIPFSPYRSYVGMKIPEGKGWNGALYADESNLIPIVTVDENGVLTDRKDLIIEIYDVYWRWWWERSEEDDLARYVANKSKNLIKTTTISTKNGKALFDLNLGNNQYGRKFIRVIDPVSGHSAGQTFYVTYKGWWDNNSGDNPGGAEMLTFTTDKKTYQVGEKIIVQVPVSNQGRILASIESGSEVLKTFWVDLKDGKYNFELEATEEMAPNVYVHLSLIQPHSNVKNDLPIRMFGVQPITIENANTHLEPVLKMPDELAPEEKFVVQVSESSGKKMTYTLAIVDDGLLDLTRFKTPDLWSHFYAKEALSVHTWDMYKYVIGAFTGKMSGLLALGGDEFLNKTGGAKANRFKPVVEFLGPFELSPKGKNSHTIAMPNYVGSVRTMIVASNEAAYGSVEKTTPVKKPLMVLATAPRVVGPEEKVVLPVTVFVMDKNVKNVSVTVQTNELLQIQGEKTKTVSFEREGDQVVNFDLNVASTLGIGKVKVLVKSGSEKATYDIELDVRAPNPRITDTKGTILQPGETWETTYRPIGMKGTNKGVVEVSSIPSLKLEDRLQYLLQYPHGCIEQTVSGAFPQLFLDNLMELSAAEKSTSESNVRVALDKLKSFQIYSGGFSYWPGQESTANDWGTNYAGHFMLEAKAKGYSIPVGVLPNWIKFQQQRANNWSADIDSYGSRSSNELIQAYRLYTLALAKKPALGAMNRMRSLKNLSVAAKWRLAAAYFLAGKKQVAESIIDKQLFDIKPYTELSYSYGSAERDKAMILETLSLLDRKADGKIVLDELARDMSSTRWYSTQTTAYTLLAVSKFIGTTTSSSKELVYQFEIENKGKKNASTAKAVSQFDLDLSEGNERKLVLKNTGEKTIFIKLQLEGIPAIGDKTNANNSLEMNVRYMTLDERVIDPSSLNQGMDFIAEVQVKHPGLRDDYKEMALTQIFPSGWEIRNLRMDNVENSKMIDQPEYQDIRDDRVLSYFDLKRGEKKTFRVLLNASYLGKYYLPTVNCEAMYDNEINARKGGKWVEILQAGSR